MEHCGLSRVVNFLVQSTAHLMLQNCLARTGLCPDAVLSADSCRYISTLNLHLLQVLTLLCINLPCKFFFEALWLQLGGIR